MANAIDPTRIGTAAVLLVVVGCGARTPLASAEGADVTSQDGSANPMMGAPDAATADTTPNAEASDVCAARQAAMIKAPIRPLYTAATLNLAGVSGQGITVDEAVAILCLGANVETKGFYGPGTADMGWGAHYAVQLVYEPATLVANELGLWSGYRGTLDFHSADNAHTYSIAIGAKIQKDGQDYVLEPHWHGPTFEAELTELYNALAATFQPAVSEHGASCVLAHDCVVNDSVGYIDMPPLNVQFWSNDIVNEPTTIAIVNLVLSGG